MDAALAEVVVFLAEEGAGPGDPFALAPPGITLAARAVIRRRQEDRRREVTRAVLDTSAVVALVGSINDRKGVDRRRQRGQLLGWRAGNRVVHPRWQFDMRRGESRPGLPDVLAALREVRADPEAMDELMRARRDDLGGRTLADLLAAGQRATVIALIRSAGDQS